MQETEYINVYGARVHNLKDIDAEIPRNSLTVITGLSGSGKASLAFDTIFAEGQRRYIETFSAYARNFLGNLERPDVDKITGLSPVISIEQKTTNKNPRSTVGTTTEIYDYLRLLYARAGVAYSYLSGEEMVKYTEEQILDLGDVSAQKLAEILKNAKTILWNGPVGVFEFPNFRKGTEIVANAIADSEAFSIAGGGDTLAAIDLFGIADKISYISTGGGAFLEFVEGKVLPAVAMLEERAKK